MCEGEERVVSAFFRLHTRFFACFCGFLFLRDWKLLAVVVLWYIYIVV